MHCTVHVFLESQNQLQNGSSVALAANPTGADIITGGAGVVKFSGSPTGIAVKAINGPSSAFNWENVVFPAPSGNPIQCGDGIGVDPGPCPLLAVDPNLPTSADHEISALV